jgi:hypothetical protein
MRMTVPRGSTLKLVLAATAATCAMLTLGAACTTGVTPDCDSGDCLIGQPPDGSIVGEGAAADATSDARPEAAAESGPEVAPEAAPEAAGEGGSDAPGG